MQSISAQRYQKHHLRRFSRIILYFGIVILLLATAAGCSKEAKEAPKPPVVEVMTVLQKDVPIYREWIGTLDGMVNATIRAQVQGYLIKQNYREGDLVKKGQILFEIDPRTFQASLEQARGQLEAQQARWNTAKATLARIKPLAAVNAVSKKDLDDAVGAEQAARAAVLAAQASVDKAKLDLGFTKIVSPIDGIAGLAKAQLGNLVGPGAVEELTTVSTVNPIKFYFQVSEQEYLQTAQNLATAVERKVGELILADGSVYPEKGRFAFADRQVDITTGTIKVAAVFPNTNNFLRPGQYGRIRVAVSVRKDALLVPQRSVSEVQGKYMVAVIGADSKADIRPVKAAERVDNLWVILEGLQPGERIIVEGIQKVRPGMPVTAKAYVEAPVKNEAKPAAPPEAKQGEKPQAPSKPAEPAQAEKR
ncbi:membrane fusion protein, multidrug efflux system [Syntrophus gentianae]|uniref:Membrane fusion protein, multidrug efflux system n=1 Tax=Syntrophus gentianae TaxID=43775 RepID=A0A1H7VXC0_9BACT|nr:efflux RND transporter periplasmic adaptor subunit [Syntrophus gentianae]SEM13893.1 membrane fusion protein, multidrug efflux system [Syntrophus gentianae]